MIAHNLEVVWRIKLEKTYKGTRARHIAKLKMLVMM